MNITHTMLSLESNEQLYFIHILFVCPLLTLNCYCWNDENACATFFFKFSVKFFFSILFCWNYPLFSVEIPWFLRKGLLKANTFISSDCIRPFSLTFEFRFRSVNTPVSRHNISWFLFLRSRPFFHVKFESRVDFGSHWIFFFIF